MTTNSNRPDFPDAIYLGIPDLDRQHEAFFTMLAKVSGVTNDLYKVLDDDEVDDVLDILYDLRDYALEHFGTEEGFMKEVDYPGIDVQRAEHNRFISDVIRMEAELMNGSAIPAIKVHNFVHDWLHHHIAEYDQPFGEFYKKKKK